MKSEDLQFNIFSFMCGLTSQLTARFSQPVSGFINEEIIIHVAG